jgi:RNA polymerase sigma factor (sigma-70 family)
MLVLSFVDRSGKIGVQAGDVLAEGSDEGSIGNQMPDQEDLSLSERRQGQFQNLYETHYSAVYAFIVRRVYGSKEDAADIASEVFMTAWRRVDQLPAPPEDRLWIFGVARRVLYRHARGDTRRSRLAGRLRSEVAVSLNRTDSAEGVLTDRMRVQAAIARLSPSDRDVLSLVYWEHLNQAEVAKVLGCSINAVALRLLKAKARLREALQRDQVDGDERSTQSQAASRKKEVHDES